jgi:adenylate kinase family enzyme
VSGASTRHRKIHIIGGPGSGKTFIAAWLSRRYDLPAFDLDEIYWDGRAGRYGVRAPEPERDAALARILDGPGWIIEGVYYGWLSRSFEAADRIVILTPSVWTRDARLVRRFLARKAGRAPTKRETAADLWRLIRWNHRYEADHLAPARAAIAHLSAKTLEGGSIDDVLVALERPGAEAGQRKTPS